MFLMDYNIYYIETSIRSSIYIPIYRVVLLKTENPPNNVYYSIYAPMYLAYVFKNYYLKDSTFFRRFTIDMNIII